MIWLYYILGGRKKINRSDIQPSVCLITVARNAGPQIADKLRNSLSINYPREKLEIIVFSDGSTDDTEDIVKQYEAGGVRLLASKEHRGKIEGMNMAVKMSRGEILFFSDVDTVLEKDSILNLVRYFGDPEVGGVAGRQTIYKDNLDLEKAQKDYKRFDTTIKSLESRIGSISSNDGTLYAIRKRLFHPIPPAVTDDLHVCLSIVKQKYRFIYEPEVKAYIRGSSRDIAHEIERRRRIVSTSLRGIFLMRGLLNPFRYGFFSIRLFINKIVRRLLPFCLILLLLSSNYLSPYSFIMKVFLFMQVSFYALAILYLAVLQHFPDLKSLNRLPSLAFYFCLGNYGMMLGVFDFLRGRKVIKWEPEKTA